MSVNTVLSVITNCLSQGLSFSQQFGFHLLVLTDADSDTTDPHIDAFEVPVRSRTLSSIEQAQTRSTLGDGRSLLSTSRKDQADQASVDQNSGSPQNMWAVEFPSQDSNKSTHESTASQNSEEPAEQEPQEPMQQVVVIVSQADAT